MFKGNDVTLFLLTLFFLKKFEYLKTNLLKLLCFWTPKTIRQPMSYYGWNLNVNFLLSHNMTKKGTKLYVPVVKLSHESPLITHDIWKQKDRHKVYKGKDRLNLTYFSACFMRVTLPSFRSNIIGVFQFLVLRNKKINRMIGNRFTSLTSLKQLS